MEFPVTGKVLEWAIERSGWSREDVAGHAGVPLPVLDTWIDESAMPNKGQVTKVAKLLKRELAFFLLPEPPPLEPPSMSFRGPKGERRTLNPAEVVAQREALRLQDITAWIRGELEEEPPRLPRCSTSQDPEDAGAKARRWLDLDGTDPHAETLSASAALRVWREAVEKRGVLVLAMPLGAEALRGFSVHHPWAPLLAYNTTTWKVEARAYTLFHELGHLLTRTESACNYHQPSFGAPDDPVERWCEQFAAAILMPWDACERFLTDKLGWHPGTQVTDVGLAKKLATRFRVSLTAAVVRLITRGAAQWSLFKAIPRSSDFKNRGGGHGGGRDRLQIRRDEYGESTLELFRRAHRQGVVSSGDVISYLRLDIDDLSDPSGEAA